MNREKTENRPQVRVMKEFGVPPEKVFDAWVDPKTLGRWMFGPEVRDEQIVSLETDPRKGGAFSFVVRRGDDQINHVGTYLEVKRPRRLVFTWGIESESEGESVVTIEIESRRNGCRLTLLHDLDPRWSEYADRTRKSWDYMLGKLGDLPD